MSTIELKELLKNRISEINDDAFLIAINTILDIKTEKKIILTQSQISDILISREEIKKGLGIDNDELDLEISKWLQEK